jgi:hypothetical protein
MKQNPFSLYDFLGYFIPGSLVLYLYLIIDQLKKTKTFDITNALTVANNPNMETVLLFIIISYVFGHFLSYISSITIEQYANWKYDYPSKYLLGLSDRHFWKGLHSFHCYFWRIVLIIFLAPMVILDFVLGRKFGFKKFYHKRLDNDLIRLIVLKMNDLVDKLGINEKNGFNTGAGNNQDFYRIVHHYVYENSKNHQSKLNNYVALYGFLRTLTLLLTILFWYIVFHIGLYSDFNLASIILLIVLSLVIYVFFMGFMKFYRRYTLEGLMILAISKIE